MASRSVKYFDVFTSQKFPKTLLGGFKGQPASCNSRRVNQVCKWFPPITRTDRVLAGLFETSHGGMTRSFLTPIISQSRWCSLCVHTLPHLQCGLALHNQPYPSLWNGLNFCQSIEFTLWKLPAKLVDCWCCCNNINCTILFWSMST